MSEIDIRRNGNEMVDKIRFTDDMVVKRMCHGNLWIGTESPLAGFNMRPEEVPDLIKALQKYLELYGER